MKLFEISWTMEWLCKCVSSVSGQAYSAEYSGGQDALVKRGYILHSLEGGNPRYSLLYIVPPGTV